MRKILMLCMTLLFCSPSLFAQQSADDVMVEQIVNQLISKKTVTFVANRILTSGSNQSMLNQLNTMTINKDTLIVNLPYSGKGFSSADMDNKNPLQFTTTEFTYSVAVTKKGEKIITMEVTSPNGKDRFTFTFTVGKGILAKLMITGTTRSQMNYSGYIQEIGADKKEDK